MEDTLLHGDLDLYILEARHLPNMDLFAERLRRCFACCNLSYPISSSARSTPNAKASHRPKAITSDPYVTVSIAGAVVARTFVVPNEQNPRWNQHCRIPLAHSASHLEFQVKDNDFLGAQVIGTVSIPTSLIALETTIEEWYEVQGHSRKLPKPTLHLRMKFVPVSKIPKKLGVDRAYFPVRTRGEVTLYQDAHVREEEELEIKLDEGKVFTREKCWEDICHAILDAHKLIYIVGWSVYDKVRLVREQTRDLPNGGDLTLGELLKFKSEEGVRVLLLVWDDKSSHDRLVFKSVRYFLILKTLQMFIL